MLRECRKKGEDSLKKLIAVLLALALLCTCAVCETEGNAVTVATLTGMRGNFFTDLWGNGSTDLDVQNLIHGLSTVEWVSENSYEPNPTTVKELLTQENEDGSKTFYVFLNEGLCYSDGSEITAEDYVFTVLLLASPQVKQLGGAETAFNWIKGYRAYHSGETDRFSGVRLMSRYLFSLTVDSAFLPFFYEDSYVDVMPYPVQVLLGNYSVADSAQGAYLKAEDNGLPMPFAAENLKTRLFGKNGYMSSPSVVSGPYCLKKYDAGQGIAVFVKNPYYPGNVEGIKPSIEKITLVECDVQSAMAGLKDGSIDLINQCVSADMIDGAIADGFAYELYPRRGLGYVCFACERKLLSDSNVRRAITCATDRSGYAAAYLGNYGVPAYGYYGMGQWMTQIALGNAVPEGFDEVYLEDFSTTPFDTQKARQLLKNAGYADGIDLTLAIPEGSEAGRTFVKFVSESYAAAGIGLRVTEIPFAKLLDDLYGTDERDYDAYFLGSNFSKVFDVSVVFETDGLTAPAENLTRVTDEQLYGQALAMRSCAPGNIKGYFDAWCAFQQRFGEVMPLMPLYSNLYADLFGARLTGYGMLGRRDWTEAILYASVS